MELDDISYNKDTAPRCNSVKQLTDICHDVGNNVIPHKVQVDKRGHISVVGTGIKAIAHCTLESLTEIKRSEYVFFVVDDTVSELFLKDLRPDGIDLNVFMHDYSKDTFSTCVQVVEICLYHARKGSSVCVVLHGDSNMIIKISQRLSILAKCEGISLNTVPSPGLKDSLVASMGIDVSIGTVVLNAVEFLLSYIDLDTSSSVILRQLGDINTICHTGKISGLQCFQLLVDKLIKFYEDKQDVILYQGSQYCLIHPPYEQVTLNVLSHITEEELEQIPADCSLYIPFKDSPSVHIPTGMTLSCLQDDTSAHVIVKRELGQSHDDYGLKETQAIQALQKWVVPDSYIWTEDNDLSDLLCEMSLNSNLLHYWEETGRPILEESVQNIALQSKDESAIGDALRHSKHRSRNKSLLSCVRTKKITDDGRTEHAPHTIRQMIVLYEDDDDDRRDDSSVSSNDSDIIREVFTEIPAVEPSPPEAVRRN
ncbi:uncharacterized protein LOC117332290 [Pecten maximus]|uniref:uncharacterized protein LOC117332290 n=1 Tax=Pecten maximus TaxID=6579 RepID=UPI001458D4C6|nr:uncharacterized protein LOC117332290 [Pecten maximus]